MPPTPSIAIVGATGAVGREFLAVLEQRRFRHGPIKLLASARSAGTTLRYRGEPHTVETLTEKSFKGIDLALFSAGGSISKQFCPIAARAGAVVVDNSSAFRMDPAVPLVVPEVNPEALNSVAASLRHSVPSSPRIIANPNCSTIIMLLAVNPLRKAFGIDRIVVSTYQAVSGAGAAAMEELREQTAAVLAGRDPKPKVFHEPCAFNVFSHNTTVDPRTGRNVEEEKMIAESRKIWNDPAARITATCIRVPTMRAHAESINVALSRPATEEEVRESLAAAPGVQIVDDRAANRFPTPLGAAGGDLAQVGRIRPDESQDEPLEVSRGVPAPVPGAGISPTSRRLHRGFDIFVCADQLRKGAALNAVQIAELLFGS